jgi:hypothetical protein
MQSNRSDPPIVPGDPKLSEQALLKETDLQRCIESLQRVICDLLIENEKLRQNLDADKFFSFSPDICAENTALFDDLNRSMSTLPCLPAN